MAKKRTAVLVIHGMGEQLPMKTLTGFVDAAWTCDDELVPAGKKQLFSKPDRMTGGFELRRLTTRTSPELGRRVDFFEFYWAHLMSGNTVSSVVSWLASLLVRRPSSVPRRLVKLWLLGLGFFLVALALFLLNLVPEDWRPGDIDPRIWAAAAAAVAIGGFVLAQFVAPIAGDAARYLTPKPPNIGARQAIREAGVDLLRQLHECDQYDRIIVASHSLGTVVGYDILTHGWARIDENDLAGAHPPGGLAARALERVEAAAIALRKAKNNGIGAARIAYRDAQRAYSRALAEPEGGGRPAWLVSDFVTMGSPLSKADVLLAYVPRLWRALKERREAPSSPPWMEKQKQGPDSFSYPWNGARIPDHASMFAPTVWTNVFYDNPGLAAGDLIAGPVAPVLGRGIVDVRVKSGWPSFRHTSYWKNPSETPARPSIRALRKALNLRGDAEEAVWGAQVGRDVVRAEELAG
ncbi:hypothetical protein [Allosphingosinicella sp.]|jgi:hypothetical protein|uniref:hypothetical protein n=1 Tax=Allosphingosinicella sp. TaxID=2823234 RepID=UPI002EF67363